MAMKTDPRSRLLDAYGAALQAVRGDVAVRRALTVDPLPPNPVRLLAMGKAAVAMARGALDVLGERVCDGLVVTRHGYGEALPARLRLLEAGHPVPDDASLRAGRAVLEAVDSLPAGWQLLALVSGGASALVEALPEGMTLADLERLNRWLLASGLPIHAVNRIRQQVSCLKGGRLAARLKGRAARVLLVSDVAGDDPALIASGPFHPPPPVELPPDLPPAIRALLDRHGQPFAEVPAVPHRIVAANRDARAAALAALPGMPAFDHGETLTGDAAAMGRELAAFLRTAPPGLHVWGGETTVTLPPAPGRGGRSQHLALAAALELAGTAGMWLLAAGTDGSDGPTEEAGALVDGGTVARGEAEGCSAQEALVRADSGRFLAASGDLISTGPTGTNVMDLVLALKVDEGA